MNFENLNLLVQLIESIDYATKELEKAVERKDIDRIRRVKIEILNFQKQMSELLE